MSPRRWFPTPRANLSSIRKRLSGAGVYPAPKDPVAVACMWLENNGRLLCSAFVHMLTDKLQINFEQFFSDEVKARGKVLWTSGRMQDKNNRALDQSLNFSVDGTLFTYANQGASNIVFKGGRYALRFEKQIYYVPNTSVDRNRADVRSDENCVNRLYGEGLGASLCRGYMLFPNSRANAQFVKELPPKGSYAFISVSIMESCAESVMEYIRRIEDEILKVIILRLNDSGPFLSPDDTSGEKYWKKYKSAESKIKEDIKKLAGADSALTQAQLLSSDNLKWMKGELGIAKMRLDVLQEKIDLFYNALRSFLSRCVYVDFHSGNLMLCDGERLKLVDEDAIKAKVPHSINMTPRLKRVGKLFIDTADPNYFLFKYWINSKERSSAFEIVALRALNTAEKTIAKDHNIVVPF